MSVTAMEVLRLDVGSGVVAFSTLRGVDAAADAADMYSGFNVCHYTGDDVGHVAQCRCQLADFVGVDVDRLIVPRQTHSVHVAVIDGDIPDLEGVDALVTCRNDVALVINTADCLPIVFNDGKHGVTGVAHGGWRGLYDGIIPSVIAAMIGCGASVSDICVSVGPSICVDCYEVDEAFAMRFAERFGKQVVEPGHSGGKPHVNLREVAKLQLEQSGILPDRISVACECSKCDKRFFSARRMGVESGRIATVVKIV